MFFDCPFSQACWIYLGIKWDLSLQPLDMIIASRQGIGSTIFREIVIVAAWSLWMTNILSFAKWRTMFFFKRVRWSLLE
ncbi:hypothetical protein HU200_050326 [Digitaria exilis]|uniref:Uncharacterized protein n=1 Tax=Digitaria exilis TaxID=1010633 RepID=A0A835APB9_9POAL|nr:hypothetical protein HU200_050326 [Digitaria exilis]